MAAAKCNISFDVNYTSSIPITSATASYKISGSSDPDTNFSIPLVVPYSGSSFSVNLPDIQTPGNYDLTVTLTTADGVVTKNEANAFKIGNCSGNKPPTVNIMWQDNFGKEDRVCNTSTCNDYTIMVVSSDSDNDIVSKEVFMSQDEGATWQRIISNLQGTTFGTAISTAIGTSWWYKVVVTDSKGNSVPSNILKYATLPIGTGDIVLVYDGVEHRGEIAVVDPATSPIISMSPQFNGNTIAFSFKNKSTSEVVKCVGVGMPQFKNAMDIFKYGNPSISPIIAASPYDGELIFPDKSIAGAFQRDSNSGLCILSFIQKWVNDSNYVPLSLTWLVNITNVKPTIGRYQISVFGSDISWYDFSYTDEFGATQNISDYVGNGERTVCAVIDSVVTGQNCISSYLGDCFAP